MEKRFRALRIIGTVYKVFAWIVLFLGGLSALLYFVFAVIGGASTYNSPYGGYGAAAGPIIGLVFAVVVLLYAIVLFLVLYGAGEAIFLALAVEENTRRPRSYCIILYQLADRSSFEPDAPKFKNLTLC